MDTIYSFRPVSTKAGRDQAHFDPKSVERKLRKKLDDWRTLLRRHIPQVRQMVKSGSRRSHSHPLKRRRKVLRIPSTDCTRPNSHWIGVCKFGGVPKRFRARVDTGIAWRSARCLIVSLACADRMCERRRPRRVDVEHLRITRSATFALSASTPILAFGTPSVGGSIRTGGLRNGRQAALQRSPFVGGTHELV